MSGAADAEILTRWWQEHSELDRLVEAVETTLASRNTRTAGRVLEDLVEAMEAHFGVEENIYFPLVERVSPKHTPAIRAARREHQKIRESLEDLGALIERAQFDEARRSLALLLDRFHSHEAAETELVDDLERIAES